MFILHQKEPHNLRAAVFDFDGTLSTLRCGWEAVMLSLMTDYLGPQAEAECKQYIDESTGIQTIHQMKWLCEKVMSGQNPKHAPPDPWFFKEEYNRRLMVGIDEKRRAIAKKPVLRQTYLIPGAENFLQLLQKNNIALFAASGTDETDVQAEAKLLGLAPYFQEIHGAQPRSELCGKEAVLRNLLKNSRIPPEQILICGDGKVEIRLGARQGCPTLGIASREEELSGAMDSAKKARLTEAGADAIAADFSELPALADWLGIKESIQ